MRSGFRYLICLLALAGELFPKEVEARVGTVETREGRIYTGQVRLESNSVVVVNAATALWIQIPLTGLAGLTLEAEPDDTRAEALPSAPWREEDVGSARAPGSADWTWGPVTVRSAGTNIDAGSDAFRFVFKPVRGNSELIARVRQVTRSEPGAKAGIMMRADLTADAANVFWGMNAQGSFLQSRPSLGAATLPALEIGLRAPQWLRLKRDGDVFTAFFSRDGRHWRGAESVRVPLGDDMLVGLAVSGGWDGLPNSAVFDSVEEAALLRNRWFTPRVALNSGSIAAGHIELMDDSYIRFYRDGGTRPVSTRAASNLRFRFVPDKLAAVVATGRPGVLLSNGEFLDSECRGIRNGKLTMSSVPLGLREFDLHSEVIAVVLRRPAMADGREFLVRTVEGSTWYAREIEVDGQSLILREPALGLRRVPLHELVELRRRT